MDYGNSPAADYAADNAWEAVRKNRALETRVALLEEQVKQLTEQVNQLALNAQARV